MSASIVTSVLLFLAVVPSEDSTRTDQAASPNYARWDNGPPSDRDFFYGGFRLVSPLPEKDE